jgi:hypothetical protein
MCDLERGAGSVPVDTVALPHQHGAVTVLRPSDHVSDGACFAGTTRISSGSEPLQGIVDATSITFGCSEHDSNGGDCEIRGLLYCR